MSANVDTNWSATESSHLLYVIKPIRSSLYFEFGASDDYRGIAGRGSQVTYILNHPRANNVQSSIRDFLVARGALAFHKETGRPHEIAMAGRDDANLHAALGVAISAGATLCMPATPYREPKPPPAPPPVSTPVPAKVPTPVPAKVPTPVPAKVDDPLMHMCSHDTLVRHRLDNEMRVCYGERALTLAEAFPALARMRALVEGQARAEQQDLTPSDGEWMAELRRRGVNADVEDPEDEKDKREDGDKEDDSADAVLADWLRRRIVVTGQMTDYVLLKDVVKAYEEDESIPREKKVVGAVVKRIAKAYLLGIAVSSRNVDIVNAKLGWERLRGVVFHKSVGY